MLEVQTIKRGDKGPLVEVWQTFLRGKGLYRKALDGDFGIGTESATHAYEMANGLVEDGVVDDFLWDLAIAEGLDAGDVVPYRYPAKPNFGPLGLQGRQKKYGRIEFVHMPLPNNPEHIRITNGWEVNNVRRVEVPQATKIYDGRGYRLGWPSGGKIWFHEKGAENLLGFFAYVEEAGLLDRLVDFGGSWVPRLVRGSSRTLSNHAHAVAFDINVPYNWMGQRPAAIGKKGSLLEIVPLAHAWGFYWGGHFQRKDGMHFELTDPTARPKEPAAYYTEVYQSRV